MGARGWRTHAVPNIAPIATATTAATIQCGPEDCVLSLACSTVFGVVVVLSMGRRFAFLFLQRFIFIIFGENKYASAVCARTCSSCRFATFELTRAACSGQLACAQAASGSSTAPRGRTPLAGEGGDGRPSG